MYNHKILLKWFPKSDSALFVQEKPLFRIE